MRLRALPMKTETLGYEKSLETGKLGHFLREREEEEEKEKPNGSRSPQHPSPPRHTYPLLRDGTKIIPK